MKTPDWKSVVQSVAPALATALGGPLAGTATAAISEAIFGKPDATEAQIEQALTRADPDMLLKLKEADQNFAVWMRQIDVDLERIAAADRADARTRDIATKDYAAPILGTIITLGFFGLLSTFFFVTPPAEAETVLQIMLGALGASYLSVVTYYFGSSVGSKHKTDLFANLEGAKLRRQ
jgi:hypothetical protein